MALFNDLYLKVLNAVNRDEEGQGLAEYALILALIAIVAIVALIFLGSQVSKILSTVGTSVSHRPDSTESRTPGPTGPGVRLCPGCTARSPLRLDSLATRPYLDRPSRPVREEI
jgi:pilus assembly protein Flp/PilA